MVSFKQFASIVSLLLITFLPIAFADSEIIFPRVEIVNKTQVNSVEVTEILQDLPKQKISEVVLKSDEFTIFKQKQAGDYVLLTIVKFDGDKFLSSFFKMMLTFHSESSATFAFYDLDNKLILSDINIAKNKEEKVDVSLNGEDDIILGYLGYDVNELPSFKVKAYLPENTLYHKGHFCELKENQEEYECYKEASDGTVEEKYSISVEDLQLVGSTVEEQVQDIVRKEAIEEKNAEEAAEAEKNLAQIGEAKSGLDWWKILLIGIIVILVLIAALRGKKAKKNSDDDYSGGDYE